jgi:hypothetical protein
MIKWIKQILQIKNLLNHVNLLKSWFRHFLEMKNKFIQHHEPSQTL